MSTYDSSKPEDTGFLSEAPTELRNNFKGLKEDQIVDAALLKGLAPGNVNGQIPINNGVENENLNAGKLNNKTASDFAAKVHIHDTVTASSDGFMTAMQNNKLANIAAGAEINQVAFSNVLIGGTTIQADSKTDTLEIVAGANIALSPDAINDRITIDVTGTVASATTAGTCTGNSFTATRLTTARTIATSGDAIGVATAFDGMENISIPITLIPSGVTAGTYKSVTVDTKGRTIAGTNPTTLSGYGITDAYSKTESNTNFAPGNYGLGTLAKDISNQSIAVVVGKSGFYKGNNVAAAPNSNWWYFNVVAHDPISYTTVEAINFFGTDRYTARWDNGIWSGWTQIATANMIPAYALGDGGHYFATNGYQILNNGLFFQWGLNSVSPVVFPVAFPSVCLNVTMSHGTSTGRNRNQGVSGISKTGFTVGREGSDPIYWHAIGV